MDIENKTQETPASEQLKDSNAIFNAFKKEFSTTVNVIMVNSAEKEYHFRDVTVNEQKTLSKTSIQNEARKDIIYDTQCQLINTLCLDKGFNVYSLTEFDRIKILMMLYQNNFQKNEIKYKCTECGAENIYTVDFQKIIDKLDKFDLSDDVFTAEDGRKIFKFTINYPLVRSVSNFYKDYMKKYKGKSKMEMEILDNLGNVDYINLYIRRVEMIDKNDPNDRVQADLSLMTYQETEKFIDMFPQNVILDEDNGVIGYITSKFINKLNKVFEYENCPQCGAPTNQGIGSLQDFF